MLKTIIKKFSCGETVSKVFICLKLLLVSSKHINFKKFRSNYIYTIFKVVKTLY